MNYQEFIAAKTRKAEETGFDVADSDMGDYLSPFQKAVVRWGCARGRWAAFLDTGLGKTRVQLEWARLVHERTGHRALLLAPLAVGPQTVREAEHNMGLRGLVAFAQDEPAAISSGAKIIVANYESLDKLDTSAYGIVGLDESSILKNFTGKIKRKLVESFAATPYRQAQSATPAPNDYMELGNHSEFLGVLTQAQMLATWFLNDSANTGDWRLKKHAVGPFWRWVGTWATCARVPADLGFPDDRYNLPPLRIAEHVVAVDMQDGADGSLFRDVSLSATSIHDEMRRTAADRARKAAELVNANDAEPCIVWVNTDYEADAVMPLIPGAVEVRGSDPVEKKIAKLNDFTEGRIRVLVTKPRIAGFGLNWQHCRRMVFVGLSYSFEQLYQGLRRCWRFGQTSEVEAHIILAETESQIAVRVREKIEAHKAMQTEMVEKTNPTASLAAPAVPDDVVTGDAWKMLRGDCCERIAEVETDSVGIIVYSPPFSNLYVYSADHRDMGNCENTGHFMEHYRFLMPELFRVLMPGRIMVVHCKDNPKFLWRDGERGLEDFPGEIIRLAQSCGFDFWSRVTIWKDPVVEMQRTKAHGLLHKTLCKDSASVRQGMADYLLIFRKPATDNSVPVIGEEPSARFTSYIGTDPPSESEIAANVKGGRDSEDWKRYYSILVWQRYASPVWMDIDQTRTLNYREARTSEDERHICPLQLDVIERAVELWSNKGDVVLSPFAGIGSEGYGAIKRGRRFIGIELKESYFAHACRNLAEAENDGTLDLFQGDPEA